MKQKVLFLITKITVLLIVLWILFGVCFSLFRCEDNGMNPAIKAGDLILCYRLDKKYQAQDNIVVNREQKKQICRVVAVAGDTVDISEDGLIINGVLIQEQNIHENTTRYEGGITFPVTLKKDEVFLLGDAREHVTDSRIYGPIKKKDTLGKIVTIMRRNDL